MSTYLPPSIEQAMRLGEDPAQFHILESSGKLTPAVVASLPDLIKNAIAVSYNDALTPRLFTHCTDLAGSGGTSFLDQGTEASRDNRNNKA